MRENTRNHAQLDGAWAAGGRDFCDLADDGLPQFPPAEQGRSLRLLRLSHARRTPFAQCRSED